MDKRHAFTRRQFGSALLLLTALACLSACGDSVVAPPTDGLHANNQAPRPIRPPRLPTPANPSSSSGSSGSPTPQEHEASDPSETAPEGADQAGNVEPEFYTLAAEAATPGPMGPPVAVDSRPQYEITAALAEHPDLADFQTTTPASALDLDIPYEPLVDAPAEPAPAELEPLALPFDATEVDAVRFSSPSVANVIVATRFEASRGDWHTRLSRFDLATQKLLSQADLPDRARLVDVSPDGTYALVRFTNGLDPHPRPASTQTRLDIWDLSAETGRHHIGWKPGADDEGGTTPPLDAAFVDNELVLSLTAGGELTLWDIAQRSALKTIETESEGPLVPTPGRQGALLFLGTTFGLFEAATLDFRGTLEAPRPTLAHCPTAGCSPDGAQLAAVLQRPAQELLVWDLSTGDAPTEIPAPVDLVGLPHFVDPGYLMVGEALINVEKQAPVWLFAENAANRNLGASLDRRHWLVTRPALDDSVLQGIAVPNEELEPKLNEPKSSLQPALAPGDALAIRLTLEGLPEDVEIFEGSLARALGRVCDEHGLTLREDANLVLEIRAADRRTGESIRFNSPDGQGGEIVPAHEIELTFILTDAGDGRTLWNGSARIPPTFVLDEIPDQTLEQILVHTMWRSAPAKIARSLDEELPLHVFATSLTEQLGHTRLWAGLDDQVLPNAPSTANSDSKAESERESEPVDYAEIDAPGIAPLLRPSVAEAPLRDVAVANSGILAVSSDDEHLRFWQPVPKQRVLRPLDEVPGGSSPTRVCLTATGNDFLFGTEQGQVRRYDLPRGRSTVLRDSLGGAITGLAVTSEPQYVAGTDGGQVVTWTSSAAGDQRMLIERDSPVTDIVAVPYTNRVVASWEDGAAMLLDAGTGGSVLSFEPGAGAIHDATVSSNGQYAALATETGGAAIVSLRTGEELGRLGGNRVSSVAFRPQTQELATGTAVGRIVMWNIKNQSPIRHFDGAGGDVSRIVFSADGQGLAAVVAGRRTLPIWSVSGESGDEPSEAHAAP